MDLKTIRSVAKERMAGYCRVCPICDGKACAGEVPGMGGTGTGSAFRHNLTDLAAVRLNLRTIHSVTDPDTSGEYFGHLLQTPIMAAPMTGVSYNMGGAMSEEEFTLAITQGARSAGSLGWTGDGADPTMFDAGLKAIAGAGGYGVAIIKPRAQDEIIARIRRAEAAGAVAVGVDVDGAGLVTMALKGQPVGPKSVQELREIIGSTTLPFIIKGIMTPDEAELAVDAGAGTIVVSNHGGRVLDHVPGAAAVLPAIARRVGNRVTILADGGVRSGVDVLKLLALGAHGVLVGRPLSVGAMGGGAEGVAWLIRQMTAELRQAMILTGCPSIGQAGGNLLFQ